MEVAASIRPVLDELVQHLHLLYGDRLLRVILYGSHARDEATPASDIDVMVVLRGEVRPFVEISRMAATKAALRLKYEQLISVYPLAEASFARAGNSTIASAQRGGRAVADGFLSRARTALKTAEHLLRETDDCASTISRAYYAMFFASRALLGREGVEPRMHKGVFMQLGRLYFKTGWFALHHNRALERAEDLRMLSDYADELDLDRSEAEQVVQDARAFVADAELLLRGGA